MLKTLSATGCRVALLFPQETQALGVTCSISWPTKASKRTYQIQSSRLFLSKKLFVISAPNRTVPAPLLDSMIPSPSWGSLHRRSKYRASSGFQGPAGGSHICSGASICANVQSGAHGRPPTNTLPATNAVCSCYRFKTSNYCAQR